jgi:Ca2+-binding RTX toxin-like protein
LATFVGTESADSAAYVNALYDQMYGLGGNDTLATNFVGSAALFGGSGDDHVYFLESVGGYIYGGTGNDFAAGGGAQDAVFGEEGNDILGGGPSQLWSDAAGYYDIRPVLIVVIGPVPYAFELLSGDDYLYGGDGSDGIYGFDGNDVLFGGSGNDAGIVTGVFDAVISSTLLPFKAGLFGGSGLDFLDGGAGNDLLMGGDGNDTLLGGSNDDTIFGDAGDDVLSDVSGSDQASGGAGNDKIYGGYASPTDGNILANGETGDDLIVGGAGADFLDGGDGTDIMWGSGGNDTLVGGSGNDTLVGAGGTDYFIGGDGADYFNLYYDVASGDSDYLLDPFAGQDFIILPANVAGTITYFSYGTYAMAYVPLVAGGYYLFGSSSASVAELQEMVAFY